MAESDRSLKDSDSIISSTSILSLQQSQQIDSIETEKAPRRSASSPSLRGHSEQLSTDDSHGWDTVPQSVRTNSWIRMKIRIPKIHWGILFTHILANVFTWLLIAVLPVMFSTIRHSLEGLGSAVQSIPFSWFAGLSFICGLAGLIRMWWENRNDYTWLTDHVFFPALLNSLIGLITTLIGVYGTQDGHWSVMAIVTANVTVSITLITVIPCILYSIWTEQVWKEYSE